MLRLVHPIHPPATEEGGRPIYCPLTHLRYLTLLALLSSASSLHAQVTCSEEVKLLLSPTQTQSAVQALHAGKEARGRIYFYDTPTLDLLSQGMILRLREGAKFDLTTKFRPPSGQKFVDPSGGRYECEIDLNNGVENPSFSIQNQYSAAKPPQTGEELLRLLTDNQKQLLKDANVKIDWKRIKRFAGIQSISWTTAVQPRLGKLSLELWQFPNGSILEVTAKVTPDAGQATYLALQHLAKDHGLALDANQGPKTSTALTRITATQPR